MSNARRLKDIFFNILVIVMGIYILISINVKEAKYEKMCHAFLEYVSICVSQGEYNAKSAKLIKDQDHWLKWKDVIIIRQEKALRKHKITK
jgi:hypothetical protein